MEPRSDFPIGAPPAGGAEIPTFLSYTIERNRPAIRKISHWCHRGCRRTGGYNNAAAAGVLVPLSLTLGPSNICDRRHSSRRVPELRFAARSAPVHQQRRSRVRGLIASLYVGNIMLLILNLPLVGLWVRLIPRPYLYAGILIFSLVGIWGVSNSWLIWS